MNDTDEGQEKNIPPYISPTTFANFVDTHRRTLPTRIDRSMMQNIAGGDQVKILRALRFFGLIDEDGHPTKVFRSIASLDGPDQQNAWAHLVRGAYPYLFNGFDLENATQAQIEERFRELGIKGETVRKAVAFFVGLARNAGIGLSPYIKGVKKRGPTGPRAQRRTRRPVSREETPTAPAVNGGTSPTSRSAKIIRFASGGTAELRVDVDVVSLSREDREALFGWIDSMTDYEKKNGSVDSGSTTPAS